jgi:A/G-specific adenine glycosylase
MRQSSAAGSTFVGPKYNRSMAAVLAGETKLPEVRRLVLKWFKGNARNLPWRRNRDPYPVWVSEIMLQQTRVAAVLDHYVRFLALFPSIAILARASEQEVLAAWSGLGYYRRARYLHRAAQLVVREHQGSLPRIPHELRKLPGVGDYTAAAIASIAYGVPIAAVDGNVQRVIQRLASPLDSCSDSSIRDHAKTLLDPRRPGDFNQAMMELGATLCLPKKPACAICPVQKFCATRGEHAVQPRKPMRSRQIAYLLISRERESAEQVLLQQRPLSAAQMPGMWELPEVAVCDDDLGRVELTLRHAITVTNYHVRVLRFSEKDGRRRLSADGHRRKWLAAADLNQTPLTGLARKILRRLGIAPCPLPFPRSVEISFERLT